MKRVTVLFTFTVQRPKPMEYRGVRAADGGYRMESKGPGAKRFRPFMWCGSVESLLAHYDAIKTYTGSRYVSDRQWRVHDESQ